MKSFGYFILCSVLVSIVSINSYSLDTSFLQKVQTEEQTAFAEINGGQIKEGLHRIAQLFREAPLNDTSYLEPLIGPFQLFCYTASQHDELLLCGFQRGISGSEEKILQPELYPSDRLLMAGAYVLSEPLDIVSKAYLYQNIPQLISSEEKVPSLIGVGLGLLVFPEEQEVMGIPADIYRTLSVPYMRKIGDTKIQKLFVELHVLMRLKELEGEIKKVYSRGGMRDSDGKTLLVKKLNDWEITTDEVVTLSPGLNCIWVGLPTMDIIDLNGNSFALWSEMLKDLPEPQARYILLSFLQYAPYFGEDVKKQVRGVLENICKGKGSINTVEGIFARCILNHWDIREHRAKDLYFRSKELVQTGVLPGVFSPWSLYKERDKALQSAYNYFVKYCWYDYGVDLGEEIKYQNWMDKELFKQEPLYISLTRIKEATRKLRYKKDEEGLKKYYLEIAEHTPNPELKTEMLTLSKDPLREVVPRLKNNPRPPVLKILLDKAKKQAEEVARNKSQINWIQK